MTRIESVVLLGGGGLLLNHADILERLGVSRIAVLSSPRLLDAVVRDDRSLRQQLGVRGMTVGDVTQLEAQSIRDLDVPVSRTAAFSFGAPWIIRQDVIDLLQGRVFNLHGARLPQDRGGASTSWQIMRGHKYGFALVHRVDAGVDTGDILDFHEFLYDDCRTPLEHQLRYEREATALLERFTPTILRGESPRPIPQLPYLASYWPRLNTLVHGWIDWSWSGADILRFITAFDDPYPGAQTTLNDVTVHLKDCHLDSNDGQFHPFQAGIIYRVSTQYAAVCTTTGTLIVRRVTHGDGSNIALGGLRPGDRFFTPTQELERARRTRVRYTPLGLAPLDE